MSDDTELLRRYADDRDEAAFGELVRRHVNLVHSAALRQVNGDAHAAADVTQLVFTDLARKAGALVGHRVLVGWLFTSTRFTAAKLVRGEQRRRAREQEAHLMHETNPADAALDWDRVRPVLDEALGELSESDRAAILLRFFEGRNFAGVGAKLRLHENAARMRVDRALDRLHGLLTRRGVTSTSAALAAALGSQAVAAAPAGLAAAVTGAALTTTAAAGGTLAVVTFMTATKLQLGTAAAVVVAGVTGFVVQHEANAALQREIAALRTDNSRVAALTAQNAQLRRTAMEVAELKQDDAALARLQAEAAAMGEKLKKRAATPAAVSIGGGTLSVGSETADTSRIYDLSQVDVMPKATFNAAPQYPLELRAAGIGGETIVEFVVATDGTVHHARALKEKSSLRGNKVNTERGAGATVNGIDAAKAAEALEAAAVAAIGKWRFAPAQKSGEAVKTRTQIPIVFTLNEGRSAPAAEWF